ncbi:MAG: hypothetical protein QOF76_4729, partial [Solirubrobacteraceae bacterium]|nr:hypothetical protein [Solirubrobacteraceae bacterium]
MNRQERQLQAGLRFFALYSLVFAVLYVLMGAFGNSSFAFTADATAKDGLFTIVALIGAADVRRHTWATLTIIAGHAVIVAALVMMLVLGHADTFAGTLDGPLRGGAHAFAIKWLVGAAAVVVIFSVLRSRALRARLDIAYLGPGEFLTLAALAEVLIDTDPSVPPLEVAQNTDAYLRRFDAEGKWRIRLALLALSVAPLLWFHAPFSVMSPEGRREFLEKRFLRSRLPRFLRLVEQSMIRAGSQMAYIGYYRDPRSYAECGYRPIAARSEVEERLSLMPSPPPARLECLLPGNAEERMIADVVVIGTGAGGATVAHGLAAKGREVLMIERGPHVDPSQFSTDEATQLADLYRDGALTLSRDFRFHVLQGMCVGGSTVVNNAVCFRIEDELLERWNGDGYEAGLDPARLAASYAALEHRLHVTEIDPAVSNPGYQPFEAGVVKLGMDAMFAPVKTNIKDCLGCGFCNSGCAYGRKLSMLDGTLPAAQAAAG